MLRDYIACLKSQLDNICKSIRQEATSLSADGVVLDRCNKHLEEKALLEAKITLYEGHLKIGRLIGRGDCEGILAYSRDENEESLGV